MRFQMIKCDVCGRTEDTGPDYKYRSLTVREGHFVVIDFDLCSVCFSNPAPLQIDIPNRKATVEIK
jgi:hypothetical protein